MNTTLQYDVTQMQVTLNDDGTMHLVFTVPAGQTSASFEQETQCQGDRLAPPHSVGARRHAVDSQDASSPSPQDPGKRLEWRHGLAGQNVSRGGGQEYIEPLSLREQEVLEVLAQGASNQEIAQVLKITPNTVKRHVQTIFAKLGVRNRTQAVTYALHLHLLAAQQEQTEAS